MEYIEQKDHSKLFIAQMILVPKIYILSLFCFTPEIKSSQRGRISR